MYVLNYLSSSAETETLFADSRIRQIVAHFIHPPTPIPSPSIAPVADDVAPSQEPIDEPAVVISAATHVVPSGSFHFMLESELDGPAGLDIEGAEIAPPAIQGLTFGSEDPAPGWEQVEAPTHPAQVEDYSEGVERLVEEEQERLQAQQLQDVTVDVSITEVCWVSVAIFLDVNRLLVS